MISELEAFSKENRSIKLKGKWYKLAEHVNEQYVPKPGNFVSVKIENELITFLKKTNNNPVKPKEDNDDLRQRLIVRQSSWDKAIEMAKFVAEKELVNASIQTGTEFFGLAKEIAHKIEEDVFR